MPNIWRNGKYWHCYGYYPDGEKWKASTRQTGKAAAKAAAAEIEKQKLEHYTSGQIDRLTLHDALELLRDHKERGGVSAATMEIYERCRGHLLRYYGDDFDVGEIRLHHLEAYLDERRKVEVVRYGQTQPLNDHTILKELGVLRAALRVSKRHRLWTGDVASIWPTELRGAYTPRNRWLTVDEYRALLANLQTSRHRYVVAYVHTGVRASELYRSRVEGDVLLVDQRKGQRQTREVPLSEDAARVFAEHGQPSTWPVWSKGRRNGDLSKATERAGIPRVSANDFRRTFASWLCQAGVPELTVIRLMGHTSSRMVRTVYGQLAPATLRAAVDRLPTVGPVEDARDRQGLSWAAGRSRKDIVGGADTSISGRTGTDG